MPFAWVRDTASSNGATRATLYPGIFVNVRDANAVWDGVQWWWLVNVPAYNAYGYIEQHSLQVAPLNQPTPTFGATPTTIIPTPTTVPNPASTPNSIAATWPANSAVSLKFGVPFVWLRTSPSSNAPVVAVVQYGVTSSSTSAARREQPTSMGWRAVVVEYYNSQSGRYVRVGRAKLAASGDIHADGNSASCIDPGALGEQCRSCTGGHSVQPGTHCAVFERSRRGIARIEYDFADARWCPVGWRPVVVVGANRTRSIGLGRTKLPGTGRDQQCTIKQ